MANEIRTVSDPADDTPGDLDPQNLGRIHVKTSKSGAVRTQTLGGFSTSENGSYSDNDPNNILNKYDDRFN